MSPAAIHISVIIPTYNRSPVVIECLRALRRQDFDPERFEVIVVDDGSTDDTRRAVLEESAGWHGRLIYKHQENAGANVARNLAISVARGALIVIINDDSIAVPSCLTEHFLTHESYPEDPVAVLGRMTISPDLPDSPVGDLHLDASYRAFAGKTELDWRAFFTCNISLKRAFLEQFGTFDPALRWHEDVELGERLRHHGLRVVYNPSALAYHLHFLSAEDYLRIGEKEGRALAQWYLRRPQLRDTLVGIGMRTRSFPRPSLRYILRDLLINRLTREPLLWCARRLADGARPAAHVIYRAVFQAEKRRAIALTLAQDEGKP